MPTESPLLAAYRVLLARQADATSEHERNAFDETLRNLFQWLAPDERAVVPSPLPDDIGPSAAEPSRDDMREFIDMYSDEQLDPDDKDSALRTFDDFDDCIIGVVERIGGDCGVLYDPELIVKKLVSQGMSEEEAEEYFDFNVAGAYIGKRTPFILRRPPQTSC